MKEYYRVIPNFRFYQLGDMEKLPISNYLLKGWLFTILVTPLLLPLEKLFNWNGAFDWRLYPIFCFGAILFGFIASLPTLIICWLLDRFIIKQSLPKLKIKIIITLVALIGMLVTFYLWQGRFGYSKANSYMTLDLSVMYSSTILIVGLIFPLLKKSH